ncbi:MAG: CpsD/CapB family tyrosine-protein kinase [Candidatus Eremiobacteraeota bacterium]|nr:CpsD/CapB family tyrosine-protein kinase [Candidatus Eremiobacteraeota bacterium]
MQKTDHIVVLQHPNSEIAECYRTLRATLSRHLSLGKKVICLVSTWSGDGKSMVCTNLAVTLTHLHLRVVLVDGDLRLPTISKVLGAEQAPGFTDFLEKGGNLEDYLVETVVPNLRLLPRGQSQENPANLLGRERLAEIFNKLRESADCVIVDTPPMTACSDAVLIGVQTDGVVIVVNPKSWDGDIEVRHKQQLVDHNIPVLGAVLNGAAETENRTYGAYNANQSNRYHYVEPLQASRATTAKSGGFFKRKKN